MAFAALLPAVDRAVLKHLGGAVSYAASSGPYVGTTVEVQGVFDATYLLADVGGTGVSSSVPAVSLLLCDLPGHGDEGRDIDEDEATVTVGGVEYRVRETRRDGQGMVTLLLREAE